MGKKVVTLDEMIELAIGTPESAVNFLILQKVLKIIARYCCRINFKFELDMDDLKADVNTIGGSRSSNSFSGSFESGSEQSAIVQSIAKNDQTEEKNKKDSEDEENEDIGHDKSENDKQEHSAEHKESKSSNAKESAKKDDVKNQKKDDGVISEKKDDGVKNERKESDHKMKKDESKKKSEKEKKRSSERHRKRSSENIRKKESEAGGKKDHDNTKSKIHQLQDLTRKSENRTNDLENQFKELTNRVETITQTIASHLDEKHLAEINGEIEKLKKETENTSDQCNGVTNTINDQSSQIQDILATINNIQLKKVSNEELIDLLSGKADHSFVSEKVSTNQFNDTIQELKDTINESSLQVNVVKLETNNNLDEIKQELHTKLFAEEFDTAKIKIYKEIIKLTEQQTLILAQQNEHVAAGAKMRNLNCFVCNNDVVMLLEQETIPKFRGLKTSLQALEPLVGSKINVGKNTPEWKNHQLKAKDFTRNSKASRHKSNLLQEKSTYIQGRNGYIYKGNAGCDCVEGMNTPSRLKREKCCGITACCDTVEAKNIKNISNTSKGKSTSNIIHENEIIENTGVGDVPKRSCTKVEKDKMNVKDLNDAKQTTVSTDQVNIVPGEATGVSENNDQITKADVEIENPLDGNLAVNSENNTDPTINEDQAISDHPGEVSAVSDNTEEMLKSEVGCDNQ